MSQSGQPTHREVESGILGEIDRSFRCAAMLLVFSAVNWLVLASVFGVILALKLLVPDFLAATEWLTYGRVEAAFKAVTLYGWILNAGFALTLWIMARLCHNRFSYAWIVFIAGIFWNIAVLIGVVGILSGDMTSVPWMNMPHAASMLLSFSFCIMAAWGIVAFVTRKRYQTYVSQWYFLAALIVFPWVYLVAHTMLFCLPANGVMQALVSGWYMQSLLGITLGGMGLGIAYYLIPKGVGQPLRYYYFSHWGFWLFLFLFGLTGARYLIGGPVPVWNTSLSSAAAIFLLAPAFIVAANLYGTTCGSVGRILKSPSMRFIGFGMDFFMVFIILGALLAFRNVSQVTRHTFADDAYTFVALYGFLSMVMAGGIYYMLPRLLKIEWPSNGRIMLHWWVAAIGVVLVFISLLFGGWFQGIAINNAGIEFPVILGDLSPMLWINALGWLFILASSAVFGCNFYSMASKGCCKCCSSSCGNGGAS